MAHSNHVHSRRPHARASHLARSKETNRRAYFFSKNAILTIIALAMLAVILSLLFMNFSRPEYAVKREIESIATDYYENYFYANLAANHRSPIEEVLGRYATPGISKTTLRQLLLFDNARHQSSATRLSAYCDLDDTYAIIYPYAPFTKSDYRIDYHYSCNF